MAPSRKETPSASERRYAWGVCGLLVLAVWLIYGQTLHFKLLDFDDGGFVSENPHVNHGLTWDGIKWAFEEGPFGEWYPLAPLSHMLDCQLFGLNAWGHHLTNLLLHAGTSIGLFLVLWRMTGQRAVPEAAQASGGRVAGHRPTGWSDPSAITLWPSAFVAALFAVHPQHVESVAWVSERRDVMSGLFFVLTLGAYVGYIAHGRTRGRYCLMAAMFTLGLMSKPMLVTVPPLLMLLDFWPLGRLGLARDLPARAGGVDRPGLWRLAVEKLPLFAIAAADCLVTMRTHLHPGLGATWSERLCNAPVSCVTYLVQFFYPVDLITFHAFPEGGHPTWKVAGSLVVLVVLCAAAVGLLRRCPYLFVGWFWFLGMLTPVIGLVQVADHAMADRYMYLPGIGLAIVVAWSAARLCGSSQVGRRVLAIGSAAWLAVLVALAYVQTSYWHDDKSLWLHTLEISPDNSEAECSLANELAREGQADEAIALYLRAQKHPRNANPCNNLGALFRKLGRSEEAIVQFRLALEREPNYFLPRRNLGAVLLEQGDLKGATVELRKAVQLSPRDPIAHVALARALALQNNFDEAFGELRRALDLDPYNTDAYNDWGSNLFRQGQVEQSLPYFEKALQLAPDSMQAHYNLAAVLAALERFDEALAVYRRALVLKPGDPETLRRIGKLQQKAARRSE